MGTLEIIIGPMFSGKTETLISRYNKIQRDFGDRCFNNQLKEGTTYYNHTYLLPEGRKSECDSKHDFYNKVNPYISLAVNYHKDIRYGDNIIASHNGKQIQSHNLQTLTELFTDTDYFELLNRCTYILINEAQFFPDLKDSVVRLAEEYNKHVIICGLDSDFKREKFGQIWDLIPHADTITKLKGKCDNCINNCSLFTYRVTSESEQEVIGNNNYIPLCRSCWYKETRKNLTKFHFIHK